MTSAHLRYQRELLLTTQWQYPETPIPDRVAEAFLATPRHWFVTRYRDFGNGKWHDAMIGPEELHIRAIYADDPLILSVDAAGAVVSTISQPSFVLRMLDLLDVRPGHTILEIGTGSGWNAALLAHLVGPFGRVHSIEVIPELAEQATAAIGRSGVPNVNVVAADASDGYLAGAPYDRVVFTAGACDLPRALYEQIRPGGLLLVPFKAASEGDRLFLLRHCGDHFRSLFSTRCGFVPMMGRHAENGGDFVVPRDLHDEANLSLQVWPNQRDLRPGPNHVVVTRKESQFVWTHTT